VCSSDLEGIHTQRDTFFEKLKKLPPASTLMVTTSNVFEKQYWYIEKSPTISYDTYDEYVQRLKVLLDEAVEARLRTAFPVASHLSGGIDSSPIAVLAARKLKKRKQKIHAFNWINIPKNDEYEYEAWNFSRRIAQSENIEHKEFTIDSGFIANLYEAHNFMTRGNMYYWEEYAVQDMASEIHVRTILSGWGGDELISHSGASYILDLFSKRRFVEMFKRLLYEKKYLNYSWYRFVRRVFGVVLPSSVVKRLKNQKANDSYGSEFYTHYVTKEFAQYMDTHKVKAFTSDIEVRKKQLGMYHYGHLQNRIESWALSAYPKKIEYRYPLLDKRIIEFAIGIPEEMFYPKEGVARHLMKNTIADLLPLDIVWFPKVDEIKIEKEAQKQFVATLKLLQERHKEKNDTYDNAYVVYDKIKILLQTFDFEVFNSSLPRGKPEKFYIPLIAIATVTQLVKSIEKIKHFSKEWYN
jgi:asparagine synthase (glutamine-hydrolysing)